MAAFYLKEHEDLGPAVSKQDLEKLFAKAVTPSDVKEVKIDFKNRVIKGKYKPEKNWKTKSIKFIVK